LKVQIIKSQQNWKQLYKVGKYHEKQIGFVPTMGALHNGHASLIEKCASENEISVVSIFVNPTQFNDSSDLEKYPRTFESDLKMLEELKVDYLFFPNFNDIYPDNFTYQILENDLSKKLCGAFRPGHFDGVLTVVLKLLNIIKPNRTYFGEKDYQQYKLIDGMCKAFFIDTEIITCPTIREDDGLAMSSRNVLLNPNERNFASNFPLLLQTKIKSEEVKTELEKLGFKVDYIEDINGRRFGAVYVGKVRLIDNVKL
jgi:pantoate--beta-alanine ligase